MVYHKFLKLSSLFFILFCFSDWMNFIALSSHSLILSSESSGLLLISLLNFCSVIVFFSSVISVWYFLVFSASMWNSHFVHEFFFWPWWTSLWALFWFLYQASHLSLFHLCLFLEFYLVLLFGTYVSGVLFFCLGLTPLYFIFLTLHVGSWTLDKTTTSVSFGIVVSCRKWTSSA